MTFPLDTLPASAAAAPAPSPTSMLLRLDEAARELRCTRRSLERQIAAGRLAVVHIGRSVRVERSELEDYLARLRQEEPTRGAPADRGGHGAAT